MCLHPHSVFLRIFHRSYPCVFHSIYRTFGNSIFSNWKLPYIIYSKNMGHVISVVTGHRRCLLKKILYTHVLMHKSTISTHCKNSPPIQVKCCGNPGVNPASHEPDHNNEIRGVGWLNQPNLNKYQSNFGWFPPFFRVKILKNIFQLPPPNQVPPGDNWKKSFPN